MYAWNPILNSLVTHSMSGHADKYLHSSDALGNFNYHNKLTMLMIAQSYRQDSKFDLKMVLCARQNND